MSGKFVVMVPEERPKCVWSTLKIPLKLHHQNSSPTGQHRLCKVASTSHHANSRWHLGGAHSPDRRMALVLASWEREHLQPNRWLGAQGRHSSS